MLIPETSAVVTDGGTLKVVAQLAEAAMLACFGASWPFSVIKALKVKKVTGKSPVFLWLIFFGYFAGITFKLTSGVDWVLALYCWNLFIVGFDTFLYYRYRGNE